MQNKKNNDSAEKKTYKQNSFLNFLKKIPGAEISYKILKNIKRNGFEYTWRKARSVLLLRKSVMYDKTELARQADFCFEKDITFSVIVPLYNTPASFLKSMINSVLTQSYSKWELCLADGSDEKHAYVGEYCKRLAQSDDRIKYKVLDKNYGISGNTNKAIEMSTGDYIALFDHDDKLHPSALFEMMKVICDENADYIYTDEAKFLKNERKDSYDFFFKCDYSPDMLRSCNYICHFSAFSRELYEKVGGFRSEFDGSQDYDMILRLTEQAKKVVHIPKILYFWRCHAASVASNLAAKPYALEAAKKALASHLERIGLKGTVEDSVGLSTYRIKYEINEKRFVSILIPNKDHVEELSRCLTSIYEKTTYDNFEVIVIENNSESGETFAFYEEAEKKYPRLKVVKYEETGFNYSKINNFGVSYVSGEYILFLNNDIEIITPDWIEELLRYTQRNDVGATGMKLYYPDDTIQHAGVVLGVGEIAAHAHMGCKKDNLGYFGRSSFVQNFSAVTAAAMMVKASLFRELGGFDEAFAVAYNDVDLCMRIRNAGFLIVWTPYAEAYHYESVSRGKDDATDENRQRLKKEGALFLERWYKEIKSTDPYYNPNLTLERPDFSSNILDFKRP